MPCVIIDGIKTDIDTFYTFTKDGTKFTVSFTYFGCSVEAKNPMWGKSSRAIFKGMKISVENVAFQWI